jgi:hypothetical protein
MACHAPTKPATVPELRRVGRKTPAGSWRYVGLARYYACASTEVPPIGATPVLGECDFASTAPKPPHAILFRFGQAREEDEAIQNERYV